MWHRFDEMGCIDNQSITKIPSILQDVIQKMNQDVGPSSSTHDTYQSIDNQSK